MWQSTQDIGRCDLLVDGQLLATVTDILHGGGFEWMAQDPATGKRVAGGHTQWFHESLAAAEQASQQYIAGGDVIVSLSLEQFRAQLDQEPDGTTVKAIKCQLDKWPEQWNDAICRQIFQDALEQSRHPTTTQLKRQHRAAQANVLVGDWKGPPDQWKRRYAIWWVYTPSDGSITQQRLWQSSHEAERGTWYSNKTKSEWTEGVHLFTTFADAKQAAIDAMFAKIADSQQALADLAAMREDDIETGG